jgi:hypothetical protein
MFVVCFMVFDATFNNISVIIVAVSFIGGVIGFTPAYAISAYHHHH